MHSRALHRQAMSIGRRVLPHTLRSLAGVYTTQDLVAATTYLQNTRYFSAAVADVDDPAFFRDPALIKIKFKERLAKEREAAHIGGGHERIERQHERGSLTARERLELLFDHGSFHELDQLKAHRCTEFGMDDKTFPGDGIVTGHGLVNGRHVYAFSQGEHRTNDGAINGTIHHWCGIDIIDTVYALLIFYLLFFQISLSSVAV